MNKSFFYWFAALVLQLVTTSAHSLSVSDRDVTELYEDASLVVRGKIFRMSGVCDQVCVAKYEVAIDKASKGDVLGNLRFCSENPISLGETYVLFLYPVGAPDKDCEYTTALDSVFYYGKYRNVKRVGSSNSSSIFFKEGIRFFSDEVEYKNFDEELEKIAGER